MLNEAVEQEEAEEHDHGVDFIFSRSMRHPLVDYLANLYIFENDELILQDPRIISYVLAHARRLQVLVLYQNLPSMDDAFTRKLIGAPLLRLDVSHTTITDATIDALCNQLADTLCSLTLKGCQQITREGSINANEILTTTTTVILSTQ